MLVCIEDSTKSIDKAAIIKAAEETKAIVTVEDHNIYGGLGSAVLEVLGGNYSVPVKRIAIPDLFGESGDSESLYKEYGMSEEDIEKVCIEMLNNKQ